MSSQNYPVVKDSQWLAALLGHGLLKASFILPKAVRELCDLMRYRKTIPR